MVWKGRTKSKTIRPRSTCQIRCGIGTESGMMMELVSAWNRLLKIAKMPPVYMVLDERVSVGYRESRNRCVWFLKNGSPSKHVQTVGQALDEWRTFDTFTRARELKTNFPTIDFRFNVHITVWCGVRPCQLLAPCLQQWIKYALTFAQAKDGVFPSN